MPEGADFDEVILFAVKVYFLAICVACGGEEVEVRVLFVRVCVAFALGRVVDAEIGSCEAVSGDDVLCEVLGEGDVLLLVEFAGEGDLV